MICIFPQTFFPFTWAPRHGWHGVAPGCARRLGGPGDSWRGARVYFLGEAPQARARRRGRPGARPGQRHAVGSQAGMRWCLQGLGGPGWMGSVPPEWLAPVGISAPRGLGEAGGRARGPARPCAGLESKLLVLLESPSY